MVSDSLVPLSSYLQITVNLKQLQESFAKSTGPPRPLKATVASSSPLCGLEWFEGFFRV